MMKWFLVLFLLTAPLFSKLNGKGDFQIWNSNGLNIPLFKNASVSGNIEFRYGNNKKKLYFKRYQGGFHFAYSRHVLFHVAYFHTYHRIGGGWVAEYTPVLDLTLQTGTQKGLFISNRNRIQYRVLGKKLGGKNRWVYRNRLELIPSYRLSKKKIALFLANEFFWQEARGIDQNRIEGGFIIPYHKKTQLKLLYILRFLKNPSKQWVHHNVVKIDFSLHF